MDTNEFFRQATLRICGNLEIEVSLQNLLVYLKTFLPADRLYLMHYDREFNGMRSIAYADATKYRKLDFLTPLTKPANEMRGNSPADKDVYLFSDPTDKSVSRELFSFFGAKPSPIIILVLRTTSQMLGYLVLICEEENEFTEDHLPLVRILKEPVTSAMANALKHRQVLKLNASLIDDNRYFQGELNRLYGNKIIGADFGLKEVMQQANKVTALNSPVLLMGETGVGKDVIANAIHYSSSRSGGPFVSVNCGAIPESLIDSELFGHEKGAFTGALSRKRGRFERANKGTIFLDEIGELPLQAQVRFLKVLQSKEIERVGGVKTIPLDIRVIAATNRNLEEMVKNQEFREDLWFRLNVFPIWIPPLRDRTVDIPALIQHFIRQKSKTMNLPAIPELAPGAIKLLMDYHWPGNVRELENIVERALILNPKGPLTFDHINMGPASSEQDISLPAKDTDNLNEKISRHIHKALLKTGGKINGPEGAAAILGMNPSTLRNRMKKLGIDFGRKSLP